MSDYVKSTNFASKDALATGNPLKIVKGTEIDTEFNNIATSIATKAPLNSPTFIGTPAAPTASAGTNTTQVATTAFVKTAIDNYDAALTVSTSQIENNAVTNDKLAVGAAVANIGFTPANSTATVNLTGDQTVAGTKTFTNGIRFNDGSTQTTAAPRSWQSLSMTNYTNMTNNFGREIVVAARCNPNGSYGWTDQCFVNDVVIVSASWDAAYVGMTYTFEVPAGATFRVNFPTGIQGVMVLR